MRWDFLARRVTSFTVKAAMGLLAGLGWTLLTACATGPASPVSTPKPPPIARGSSNLVVLLDRSGSMDHNDPNDLSIEATQMIVALASEDENLAVVSFSDEAKLVVPLQAPATVEGEQTAAAARDRMQRLVGQLKTLDNTNFLAALSVADQALKANSDGRTHVIFFSDGLHNIGGKEADVARYARDHFENRPIHAIAFTQDAKGRLLQEMAISSQGSYATANTPVEMLKAFEAAARNFWTYVWVENQTEALTLPGVQKLVFVAERAGGGDAFREVLLNGQPLPGGEAARVYISRGKFFDVWSLDHPAIGRYTASLNSHAKPHMAMQRLPQFDFKFLPDRPRTEFRDGQPIEAAIRVTAANEELLKWIWDHSSASVAVGSGEPATIASKSPIQPCEPSGWSFDIAFHPLTARSINVGAPEPQKITARLELSHDRAANAGASPLWVNEKQKVVLVSAAATVGINPPAIDFGTLTAGEKSQPARISFTTDAPDVQQLVGQLLPSAGSPNARLLPSSFLQTLQPVRVSSGNPASLELVFAAPESAFGEYAADLLFGPANAKRIPLSASVIPKLVVQPLTIDLGTARTFKESPRQTFTLQTPAANALPLLLQIGNLTCKAGGKIDSRQIEFISGNDSAKSQMQIVLPAASKLDVAIKATLLENIVNDKEPYEGELTVWMADPAKPRRLFTVPVRLLVMRRPAMAADPAELNFGVFRGKQLDAKAMAIANNAGGKLKILLQPTDLVSKSGNTVRADRIEVRNNDQRIKADEACDIADEALKLNLKVNVLENVLDGAYSGYLEIRTAEAGIPASETLLARVPLTLKVEWPEVAPKPQPAEIPAIVCAPEKLDLGKLTGPGQLKPVAIEIKNTSDQPVEVKIDAAELIAAGQTRAKIDARQLRLAADEKDADFARLPQSLTIAPGKSLNVRVKITVLENVLDGAYGGEINLSWMESQGRRATSMKLPVILTVQRS